ncbi:hypothetical protein [Nonomuraea fuscirosea]
MSLALEHVPDVAVIDVELPGVGTLFSLAGTGFSSPNFVPTR